MESENVEQLNCHPWMRTEDFSGYLLLKLLQELKTILTRRLSFRQCLPFPETKNAAMGWYDPSDGEIRAIIEFPLED